jgi:phosphotriesterase-related protein
MTLVQTVTGLVGADEIGRTLVHEHIVVTYAGEQFDRKFAWTRAEIVARATDKLRELRDAGFRTLVDPCPIEMGRDPELYAEVSQQSGVQIVCTTGFYTEHLGWGLPGYWRARDAEEIAELYVAELTDGINNTGGIKAGAIKAATGIEVTDAERRVLAGAAMAQRETGVGIITHTEHSRHGTTQQKIFAEHGADLSRVLIGHQDELADLDDLERVVDGGTFVGIDRIGIELLAPDAHRADLVAGLVHHGQVDRVCLSQDHICVMTAPRAPMWLPPDRRMGMAERRADMEWQLSGRPYTYIWTDFVPLLRERGVSAKDIDVMFEDNPKRLLAGGD